MEYKEVFYNSKKYKNLSKSKLQKTNKNLKKLKKSLRFKKFQVDIDCVDFEDLDDEPMMVLPEEEIII